MKYKKSDFFETGKDGVKRILTPDDQVIAFQSIFNI